MAANLTQILSCKVNSHQEFELFKKKKNYANHGGRFKIVSIIIIHLYSAKYHLMCSDATEYTIKNIKFLHIRPYNFKK